MISYSLLRGSLDRYARTGLDKALYGLSTYAVPILIGLASILALCGWENHYSPEGELKIPLRIIEQSNVAKTPAEALAHLKQQPAVPHYDTRLSEVPFWFSFLVQPERTGLPVTLEMPSRHAVEVTCWDAKTLAQLGNASRSGADGALSAVKAGFALALNSVVTEKLVLCRGTFIGPAHISAVQWPAAQLAIAAREFERHSGLLDGGLIVLGMFVFITALINRESTYVLFAAWLIVNLRMGALSAGWDAQWLGHSVPQNWMLQGRLFTTAVYYMLTVTLFRTLFYDELSKVGYAPLLRISQLICLPLILCSVTVPYRFFLPILWLASGYTTIVLVFFLARILIMTRSPVAILYSASMSLTLFASFYEVISAALGLKGWIGSVNFVTAALSSSLLAALAIAAQMRVKHRQWLEAQAELQHTYEAMPIGLFTLDPGGHFLSANPALLAMVGVDRIAPGRDAWDRYFNADAWPQLHRMVLAQADGELEIKNDEVSGVEPKRFLVKATFARGKIEGSLQDITVRSKATEDLLFMANNDPLTRVLNRRGIDTVMENALRSLPNGIPLALAYLDLDRFKLINDLYGHAAGDEVLMEVCERIRAMLTGSQQIGRVGGDEFVIVLPGTPIALASWICRGIVDCIGLAHYHIGDKAFQVRGSIGLIEVSVGTKIKDAVSTADRACREAKSGGRDGLVVYEKNAAAFREHEAELDLVERFSDTTAPKGLFLDMQPIMSLKNPHESLNFEVLLRMRDTDGSVIPASRIIPAAESSGRIGMLDRWVLSTTLAWLNTHRAGLGRTQFVCMNLSGASLNDERFVQDAFSLLEKNRHAAGVLCLEITESVALHDFANTRRFIDRVRSYGVKIALDDFGAGYTSFSYLKDLPADVLKIDGSFIVNMNEHPANLAIVEAIVNLAMNLGMKTIAEWAEDNATVQTLVEIGVDYVQGYAVARPQAPEKILVAASSASFIQDRDLERYVRTLGPSADLPLEFPPGVTMIGTGGMLVSK